MSNIDSHASTGPVTGLAPAGQDRPAPLADLAVAMGAAALVANLEALAVAAKSGLPLPRLLDVINQSTGRGHISTTELPALTSGAATGRLDIPRMLDSIERTLSRAAAARLPLPIVAYAGATLTAAMNAQPAVEDIQGLARVLAGFAGATLPTRPTAPARATPSEPYRRPAALGYIGLGVMGSALAAQALKVADRVHVHDVRPESVAALVAKGAHPVRSLADMARRCDIILLCVPGAEEVRTAIFGDQGLFAGLAPGKIIVDQTTGSVSRTRELAKLLGQHGNALIDAPIAGGPKGVQDGAFLSFCAGEPGAAGTVRKLLEAMGSRVVDFGDAGNGHAAKLVKNALAIGNRYIAYEGLSWAYRHGLDMTALADAVQGSLGETHALQRLVDAARTGRPTATIRLALLAKDQDLICELGARRSAPMGVANLVRSGVAMAAAQLGDNANIDDIGKLFGLTAPDPG